MTGPPSGSDRWRQIEEVVRAASDVPENQRDAFLREICGDDEQLRLEVNDLLADEYEESPRIAGIVEDATAHLLDDD